MLKLVNQLLDLSKLESGKMRLQASRGDIVQCVFDVWISFESLAARKNIIADFDQNGERMKISINPLITVKIDLHYSPLPDIFA